MSLYSIIRDRRWLRAVVAAAGVVIVSAVAIVVVPGSAHAATPPFEPDPNSIGTLTFFDAGGNVVTGGSTTVAPFAAYVQASTAGRVGNTKATVFMYLPKEGVATGAWSGSALGGSHAYPNASAPGALGTSTLPLVTTRNRLVAAIEPRSAVIGWAVCRIASPGNRSSAASIRRCG